MNSQTQQGFTDREKAQAKASCGAITEYYPASGDGQRFLFCGSREWVKEQLIIDEIAKLPSDAVVISGGARGADLMAERAALSRKLHTLELMADWEAHGKRAGFLRNEAMLNLLRPGDVVVAFQVKHSVGTQLTIEGARRRGLTLRLFRDDSIEHVQTPKPTPSRGVADEFHQKPHKTYDRLSEGLEGPWTCPDCAEAVSHLPDGVQKPTEHEGLTGYFCPVCQRKRPVYSGHQEISYDVAMHTEMVATVMEETPVSAYMAGKDPEAGNRINFMLTCPECGEPLNHGKCPCGLFSKVKEEPVEETEVNVPSNLYAHAVDCKCETCRPGYWRTDGTWAMIPKQPKGHKPGCACPLCSNRREVIRLLY